VGSFGERLRREREMRGVSLDDIAEATKIGTRLLRALEDEQFELLPGGIFNKGFVRAYAKYLGLNEEEAVADYLAAAGESSPDPRVIAEQNSTRIDRTGLDGSSNRQAGFPIIPVLILLLVIAAGAGGWQIYKERQRERQAKEDAARTASVPATPLATTTPQTAATSAPVVPSGTANENKSAATTGAAGTPAGQTAKPERAAPSTNKPADLNAPVKTGEPAAQLQTAPAAKSAKAATPDLASRGPSAAGAASSNSQPFEVSVRAKDRAWISIKSDGKFAVRGIISPPDVKTVHATDQVVFYTGNAGAVEISFNGQLVPLPGGPNTEGVLVFNSHGVVIPKPESPAHEP